MKVLDRKHTARKTASLAAAMATICGTGIGIVGIATVGAGAAAAAAPCTPAGSSGFTAAVVATAHQTISGRHIDATGCDVGIYVEAPHVTITRTTVTGAKDAGILVQNTSHVTISRSTVTGNGFDSPEALPQAFGISLFGVSNSVVTRNTVYNNGRGGIGVMDTGPFDPGQLPGIPGPAIPVPSDNNVVSRNTLWANYNGCAIVLAVFNAHNHLNNDTVTRNTVIGTGFAAAGADVGGIVAQTNAPNATVSNITISRNTVTNSVESGVIVHAAAPNSRTVNVSVTRNTLSGNNIGMGGGDHPSDPTELTGVVVDSLLEGPNGARAIHTVVSRNNISNEFYGIWSRGDDAPTVSRNNIQVLPGGTEYFRVS